MIPSSGETAPRLETPAFVLSAFVGEEDSARLAAWLADPRIAWGFARAPVPRSAGVAERWIASCDGRRSLLLAIREREDGAPIGFWHVRADGSHRRAEISVALGELRALGRDAAIETGIALTDWIFTRTATEKLTANVLERNRLARVIASSWMRKEGRLLEEVRADDGRRLTVDRYGLLRGEWPVRRDRHVDANHPLGSRIGRGG